MEPVTLVAPDGRHFVTSNPREYNDLTMGHGYTTLSSKNDKAAKSAPKNETKSEEKKDDAPVPAVQDSGHKPSTDAK